MTPLVLIPGLSCTAEMFAPQVAAFSPHRPVTIASTLEGGTMAQMAAAILRDAPPRFALGGISMGGYIAFEIMRQAPERVERLTLLDTTARPDAPEQTQQRQALIKRVADGQLETVMREISPRLLHPQHKNNQGGDLANGQLLVSAVGWADALLQGLVLLAKRDDAAGY